MHVPPAYPSDATDAIGASPILPSKNNPVFRLSTKQLDAIQKCRPYPSVTHNIDPLIMQLGVDESVIAKRLEASARGRKDPPAPPHISQTNNFRVPSGTTSVLQSHPEMRSQSCQTPVLACARCDKGQNNLMNTQTQTDFVEKYSKSSQTHETDFTLSKLRLRMWDKERQKKVQNFKREYGDTFSDEDEEKSNVNPPKRAPIGPPGFREMGTGPSSNNNKNSSVNEQTRKYFDRYYH